MSSLHKHYKTVIFFLLLPIFLLLGDHWFYISLQARIDDNLHKINQNADEQHFNLTLGPGKETGWPWGASRILAASTLHYQKDAFTYSAYFTNAVIGGTWWQWIKTWLTGHGTPLYIPQMLQLKAQYRDHVLALNSFQTQLYIRPFEDHRLFGITKQNACEISFETSLLSAILSGINGKTVFNNNTGILTLLPGAWRPENIVTLSFHSKTARFYTGQQQLPLPLANIALRLSVSGANPNDIDHEPDDPGDDPYKNIPGADYAIHLRPLTINIPLNTGHLSGTMTLPDARTPLQLSFFGAYYPTTQNGRISMTIQHWKPILAALLETPPLQNALLGTKTRIAAMLQLSPASEDAHLPSAPSSLPPQLKEPPITLDIPIIKGEFNAISTQRWAQLYQLLRISLDKIPKKAGP